MKPSSWDKQLGLASPLESEASQSGQTNNPSEHEVGLDASHHTRVFSRGGRSFFRYPPVFIAERIIRKHIQSIVIIKQYPEPSRLADLDTSHQELSGFPLE